ncbi:hypothetical protein J3R83DRAFT_12626 [Lanmaoa asiatica]|nr:hypothetical protein J3R83DRAFT_12626 [Lanmaoa asiatica]
MGSKEPDAECALCSLHCNAGLPDDHCSQPYYVKSTHSLLMTSSASRSQASNVDDVLAKLHALVADSAASLIKKSPTREQRERVASLQKVDGVRRRLQKDKRSTAKKSRSSKDWD